MYKVASWLRYEFDSAEDFRFTIYPKSMYTDLDYFVFKRNGNCSTLTNIRYKPSGSDDNPRWMDTTDLKDQSMDTYEYAGCEYFDHNYVAPVDVSAGDIL